MHVSTTPTSTTSRRTRLKGLALLPLIAAGTVAFSAATASPAAAGGCSLNGTLCGDVYNWSSRGIRIADNWCWANSTYVGTSTPAQCGAVVKTLAGTTTPGPTKSATIFKDTDSFEAKAGCTTNFRFNAGAVQSVNRHGLTTSKWFKLTNADNVDILSIVC